MRESHIDPGYVLISGRIEDFKNQLRAVRALRYLGIPGIVSGSANSMHKTYFETTRRLANNPPRIRFFPNSSREIFSSLVLDCLVHVNVSWAESYDLSSREALRLGKNVVVSKYNPLAHENIAGVHSCDPRDVCSIADAIFRAAKAKPPPANSELFGTAQQERDALLAIYKRLNPRRF
ncbi:MAG: glycosyltransferase [Planctomycetes bacterium]|nr:glycosyltransferase [Planctomycetota bacterium]